MSTSSIPAVIASPASGTPTKTLLISLASLSQEALQQTLAHIAEAFAEDAHAHAGTQILVASPDAAAFEDPARTSFGPSIQLISYTPTATSASAWMLNAADYLHTYKLARENNASVCLLLGAESQTLAPHALRALADSVTSGTDLAVACYDLNPRVGLVNSAILFPVTRALYGARIRYPLALDLGLSLRMAERLASASQRLTSTNQSDGIVWPIAEGAAANFVLAETYAGARTLPQPSSPDLKALLAHVAGSFFADVEAKATFWQRSRSVHPAANRAEPLDHGEPQEVQPLIDQFRLAYTNLQEIWSLVLPPNTLLGLKRLAAVEPSQFRMADALWVRIVYDFILAYRLRTINRGHLLGALVPLYLAWVASHLLLTGGTSTSASLAPEAHIQQLASAFDSDKAYLVSRWRWPDRFNP